MPASRLTMKKKSHIERADLENVPPSAEKVLILSFITFTNVALSILFTVLGSPNAFRRSSSEGKPPNFASARIACMRNKIYLHPFIENRESVDNVVQFLHYYM